MTIPTMPTIRDHIAAAEEMVNFYRALVDADQSLTPEKKSEAHAQLDDVLLRFALQLAKGAGSFQ